MNITLIVVGKIKEKYFTEAIKEYSKRLSRYCNLKIIEVADEHAPENLSDKEIDIIKDIEGQKIIKKIPDKSYVIPLVIKGKEFTSEKLAEKIEDLTIEGYSHLTFIIGGSLGLSNEVINSGDLLLSFSKMTYPHQLMRVILLEQIYRSYRILRNEPYHK